MCNIFIGKALKMAIAKGHGGAIIDEVINIIFGKAKMEDILVRNTAAGGYPVDAFSCDAAVASRAAAAAVRTRQRSAQALGCMARARGAQLSRAAGLIAGMVKDLECKEEAGPDERANTHARGACAHTKHRVHEHGSMHASTLPHSSAGACCPR